MKKILTISFAMIGTFALAAAIYYTNQNDEVIALDDLGVKVTEALQDASTNQEIAFNYTIDRKDNISADQQEALNDKLVEIYTYFNERDIELKELQYIAAGFTKIEEEKNRMFANLDITSDAEILEMILLYNFTSEVNYGLFYGLMQDVCFNTSLSMEAVDTYSLEAVQNLWQDIYLTYNNFNPEIASEDEIKISKYISKEIVTYLIDQKGGSYLYQLMIDSCQYNTAYRVTDMMDEWLLSKDANFNKTNKARSYVYDMLAEEKTLSLRSDHIKWILHLDKEDQFTEYYDTANKDLNTFYSYMDMFYNEIRRLEQVLDVQFNELPELKLVIYGDTPEKYGGFYLNGKNEIQLNSIEAFSHEFVHFIDDVIGLRGTYPGYSEMRATYYSVGYELSELIFSKSVILYRQQVVEFCEVKYNNNPVLITEAFTEREMNYYDYNKLLIDLLVSEAIKAGSDYPELFSVSDGTYPTKHWISLMNYATKEYGDDGVQMIMLEQKLKDGSVKDLSHVIEEWKAYIENFSEKDYMKYY